MTKEELQQELWDTHKRGTLITDKHNAYKLGIFIHPKDRSVISYDITDNVYRFIDVGIDKILEYTNSFHPRSPRYLEIVPSTEFCVASSGVTSYATVASYTLDRIVAVYGHNQGLHIFGDDSKKIINRTIHQTLTNKYELKSNKKHFGADSYFVP